MKNIPDKWIVVPSPITIDDDNGSATIDIHTALVKIYLNDQIFGSGDDSLKVAEIIETVFRDAKPGEAISLQGSHCTMLQKAVSRPDPQWRNVFLMRHLRPFHKAILDASVDKPKDASASPENAKDKDVVASA